MKQKLVNALWWIGLAILVTIIVLEVIDRYQNGFL